MPMLPVTAHVARCSPAELDAAAREKHTFPSRKGTEETSFPAIPHKAATDAHSSRLPHTANKRCWLPLLREFSQRQVAPVKPMPRQLNSPTAGAARGTAPSRGSGAVRSSRIYRTYIPRFIQPPSATALPVARPSPLSGTHYPWPLSPSGRFSTAAEPALLPDMTLINAWMDRPGYKSHRAERRAWVGLAATLAPTKVL